MKKGDIFHLGRFPLEGVHSDKLDGKEPVPITSKIDFWRVPVQGRKGLAILWEKVVGKTNLFMQGVTKLHFPKINEDVVYNDCLLYTSPSPRDS